MSGASILYLLGLTLVFAGQRMFGGGGMEWPLTALGVLGVIGALGLRLKARSGASTEHHRKGHTSALIYMLVGASSLLLYAISTDAAASAIGLEGASADRWSVPFQVLWPISALVGTLPMIAVDLSLQEATRVIQPRRLTQAADNWLAAALGLALVFPLNYLASEFNKRWDLAYFKTTEVGSATRAVVENLDKPLTVRIFQASSSDVTPELRAYFDQLAGPNLTVEVIDHAADPKLVEELKIRDNGYVAVTMGEDTQSWKVGEELDKARSNLKKLDSEFHKRLLELARGKSNAYLTTGHGELSWRGEEGPDRKISGLKKVLEAQSYRVKELGLTEGLADAVPEDAAVVMILAPSEPFLPAEINTLKSYLQAGGALFIALEPNGEPMTELLAALGLARGEGGLSSEASIVRITGGKSDRANVVTNRFSSHESTTTLSKYSRELAMAFSGAGWLDEVKAEGLEGKVTITVRSLADSWAESDGNLELDPGEEKKIRAMAAVVAGPEPAEGSEGPPGLRAAVISDATAFSDLILPNVRGNQQYIWDVLNWLTGEEDSAGTVESEEDVKIQHTQGNQVAWFYGTILGMPLLVVGGGWLRVRSRRKGGAA